MKNLLPEWINETYLEMTELPFLEDDIRKIFFSHLLTTVSNFYAGSISLELSEWIGSNEIKVRSLDKSKLRSLLVKLYNEAGIQEARTRCINSANRQLILDSWSTFENSARLFCDGLMTNDELKKQQDSKFNTILNIFKNYPITDSEKQNLRNKLDLHVPITKKNRFTF